MSDEIMRELWQVKDDIAREHGYDLDALVARLRAVGPWPGHPVIELEAAREKTTGESGAKPSASRRTRSISSE